MALKKKRKIKNGLELEYHRIALIVIEPNQQTRFLVHSYLNADGRNYEKDYAQGKIVGEPSFPYVSAEYMSFEYDANMNMSNAYKRLKMHPDFKDAEDI